MNHNILKTQQRETDTLHTNRAASAKTTELIDKVIHSRSYVQSSVWLMLSKLDEWEEVKLKREMDWIVKDYPDVHREP